MSAKWEKQEGNQGTLTVEVPASELARHLIKHLRK